MILAIDVSSRLGLLSLELPDGARLTRSSDQPREHLEFLVRALAELREEAGVDWSDLARVAVTLGPGSFTGLRVGLATAKGLAFGREIPLAPLPSLALPRVAADPGLERAITVLRRARGDEYWRAGFAPGRWRPECEELSREGEIEGGDLLGDHPAADPEPAAELQLDALARLAAESEELVRGADLDSLLPRYLLAPSITPPRGSGGDS